MPTISIENIVALLAVVFGVWYFFTFAAKKSRFARSLVGNSLKKKVSHLLYYLACLIPGIVVNSTFGFKNNIFDQLTILTLGFVITLTGITFVYLMAGTRETKKLLNEDSNVSEEVVKKVTDNFYGGTVLVAAPIFIVFGILYQRTGIGVLIYGMILGYIQFKTGDRTELIDSMKKMMLKEGQPEAA